MANSNGTNSANPNTVPFRVLNMNTYVHDMMPTELQDFQSRGRIKSGYGNLDAITNIYPGFYVLGAISSLGKTTFTHQMCDQMAKAGEHILYFSLEQSALELASKSISREMYLKDSPSALTSLQIRKQSLTDARIVPALEEYYKYANNVTIIECSFSATIADIEDCVKEYIKKTGIKPVVVIDYLQVIQAPADSHKSTKDLVDTHVRRLKQLQSENNLVLIAISSLNRQNYLTQIDYESFKESGGIEYTADVIWGLQLQVLHDEIFDSQAKINEKREKVRDAKRANPRKIELVCLKNRFGVSSYSCGFEYYASFDYFKPIMTGVNNDADVDPDGFMTVPEGYDDCPFAEQEPERKRF